MYVCIIASVYIMLVHCRNCVEVTAINKHYLPASNKLLESCTTYIVSGLICLRHTVPLVPGKNCIQAWVCEWAGEWVRSSTWAYWVTIIMSRCNEYSGWSEWINRWVISSVNEWVIVRLAGDESLNKCKWVCVSGKISEQVSAASDYH